MLFMATACYFYAEGDDLKIHMHICRRVEDRKRQLPCVAGVQVRTAS